MTEPKLLLGVSSCLLGNKVRYDGQHKLDTWITESLGPYAEFLPVCPEVECGLSIPREAIRLIGNPDKPSLLTIFSQIDLTDQMIQYALPKVQQLSQFPLCGYILKSKSPSCGMERVKVYPTNNGPSQKIGIGLFADTLLRAMPMLPVEEEGRLHDPVLRENFIERIFVQFRWNRFLDHQPGMHEFIQFHMRHKLLVMAHSVEHYRKLGKLVAATEIQSLPANLTTYYTMLMEGMCKPATRSRHQNVLLHILGYFKKELVHEEKAELLEVIDHYKMGHFPLIVPITLLNHYIRKYNNGYLKEQYYLEPHPLELNLRNHC